MRRFLLWIVCIFLFACSARAQNPCGNGKQRALVLGGGGPKGAFEAGAVYHLVQHRGCDFHEFSGVSVGAMNAAFLAQAERSEDAGKSQDNLAKQAEELVELWQSIKSPKQIVKGRPLALLRFFLFGMENLKDLRPLRHFLETNVTLERLEKGRPVRAGVTSFFDGRYHEVADGEPLLKKGTAVSFLDYLYASGVLPVYGKMPRIPDDAQQKDPKLWMQFGDGGLRHNTPVESYFKICKEPGGAAGAGANFTSGGEAATVCGPINIPSAEDHRLVQQLFVIATNPYKRDSDTLPVTDPKSYRPDSRQITKGPKILNRTLDLTLDDSYRWDLDFLQFANDLLKWRWQMYRETLASTPPDRVEEGKRQFRSAAAIRLESFNRDAQDPDGPTLPYEIGLVVPEKQYAEIANLLNAFKPRGIQEQLYCGCVEADKMMQKQFGQASLSGKCAEKFPPLKGKGKKSGQDEAVKWEPTICQAKPQTTPER